MKKRSILWLFVTFFIVLLGKIDCVSAATLVETDSEYLLEKRYDEGYTLYLYWVKDSDVSWSSVYGDGATDGRGNLFWPYKEFAIDGVTSYCIEPFVSTPSDFGDDATLDDYNSYEVSDWENIDENLRDKISLIAYYGYDYTNHNTSKYRLATQALIWETLLRENTQGSFYWNNPNYTVSFYIHPNGEGYKYQTDGVLVDISAERAEIMRLVNAHSTLPSFANNLTPLTGAIGKINTVIDQNNVLENFEISNSNGNSVSISGNSMSFNISNNIEQSITFKRKKIYSQSYIIYAGGKTEKENAGHFQNMIATGNPSDVEFTVKLRCYETREVTVLKKDADTGNIIYRSGIKFKIYDSANGRYVTNGNSDIFMTDTNGSFRLNLIPGKYRLEEVEDQDLDGYLWNKDPLEFEVKAFVPSATIISLDNQKSSDTTVDFVNKAVKGSIEIVKTGEVIEISDEGYVYTETNLEGIVFGLYAKEDIYDNFDNLIYKSGERIETFITDSSGKFSVSNLFLGKYYLKELETNDNYVLDDKIYDIDLLYQDQYKEVISYQNTFKNYLKKGSLEFTKKDSITLEVLSNAIIDIYTEDGIFVFSGKTDLNGKITVNLPLGKYYILERVAPIGYELNTDKLYFEITENGEIIDLTMLDDAMKVVEVVGVGNTGIVDNSNFMVLLMLVSGIGFIVYDKLRKKTFI